MKTRLIAGLALIACAGTVGIGEAGFGDLHVAASASYWQVSESATLTFLGLMLLAVAHRLRREAASPAS